MKMKLFSLLTLFCLIQLTSTTSNLVGNCFLKNPLSKVRIQPANTLESISPPYEGNCYINIDDWIYDLTPISASSSV